MLQSQNDMHDLQRSGWGVVIRNSSRKGRALCTLAALLCASAAALASGSQADSARASATLVDPVSPDLLTPDLPPLDRNADGSCPLCAPDPGVPVVQLTAADADSLGRAYSAFNRALFERVDAAMRQGELGVEAQTREAQRRAHLLSRMLAVNSIHYMVRFATDPDRVYEATEDVLRDAFARYTDPGVYPIVRMKRGRMGMGRICVHYDVSSDLDSITTIGGQKLRIRVEETEIDGERRRAVILELPTILFSVVEVVLEEHFTCEAVFTRSSGPPAPYDLYLFHSMQGISVRKWGVHKPSALMYWSTPRDVGRTTLPNTPLVGSSVYVPGIRLELPSILPDFEFADLRLLDLPAPILTLPYLQGEDFPSWIRRARPRGLKDWESYGPIPPDLQLRFPDK